MKPSRHKAAIAGLIAALCAQSFVAWADEAQIGCDAATPQQGKLHVTVSGMRSNDWYSASPCTSRAAWS